VLYTVPMLTPPIQFRLTIPQADYLTRIRTETGRGFGEQIRTFIDEGIERRSKSDRLQQMIAETKKLSDTPLAQLATPSFPPRPKVRRR